MAFRSWINSLGKSSYMVGFNNEGYDYPLVDHMMNALDMTAEVAYYKTCEIINTEWDDRFKHVIWANNQIVPQIDLYKIHHFDNVSRATSLKMLEFNMGSDSVRELPFPPGTVLTHAEMDTLLEYNLHDVMETWKFYIVSKAKIQFRLDMEHKHQRNFMNSNDTKIGADYFIMKLEEAGVKCFTDSPKKPIQTPRSSIDLKDCILPWIQFKHPEFCRIVEWLKLQTITKTKGALEDVTCTINGFTFVFGLGGIHGCVSPQVVEADDDYAIVDLDVTAYYTSVIIQNQLFPEHLSNTFCVVDKDFFDQRQALDDKKSVEGAALKLAMNGVYGKSNSVYSSFYDPLFTMRVTLTGQLSICLLCEMLMASPDVTMIQANTDGITIKLPRTLIKWMEETCEFWENFTGLNLESLEYSRMMIKDVNNYIGEFTDGSLKRKSAYAYGEDLDWNQNHGSQVVAKAAEAYLVRGEGIRKFIETHTVMRDFFLCMKVPKTSNLLSVDWDGNETLIQNPTRYYMTRVGATLIKCMPPLKTSITGEWRRFEVAKGWRVHVCNHVNEVGPPIDYEYYIQQAEKLTL
tara:strand:- start:5420 stop:7141 length:1722 start_codon:yes stop_codon:yes gene_type:complete